MEESSHELVQMEAHSVNHLTRRSIPMAATEAILITGVIEAKQHRDITLDIPNAFVQTPIPQDGDKVMMKIRGPLVNILC